MVCTYMMEDKMKIFPNILLIILLVSCSQDINCDLKYANELSFVFAKQHDPNSLYKINQYELEKSESHFKFDYFVSGDLGGGFSITVKRPNCKIIDYYKTQ